MARVAVNLRGVEVEDVGRADALLSPDAWRTRSLLDVRLAPPGTAAAQGFVDALPAELVLHLGTAAVPVRVRPLAGDLARLTLHRPLPVEPGDRLVLRDPGRHAVAAGAVVLDADPPSLRRRGAARVRAAALEGLAQADEKAALAEQVGRRGVVRRAELEAVGVPTRNLGAVRLVGDWLVDPDAWDRAPER